MTNFQLNHLSFFQLYLLQQIMAFPLLSQQTKLNLYHFFSSLHAVSSFHPSPLLFSLFILLTPGLIILIPAVLLFCIYFLIRFLPSWILWIVGLFYKPPADKAYLELTFPANTNKSALATEQLYKLLHALGAKQNFLQSVTKQKKIYSLEIVSSRNMGIRYIMVVPKNEAELIHQTLLAYLPGLRVREIPDYLDGQFDYVLNKPKSPKDDNINKGACNDSKKSVSVGVIELRLASDFTLSLQDQKVLDQYDPISFLTSTMTKLDHDELIAFQIVTTPVANSNQKTVVGRMEKLRLAITQGKPISGMLNPNLFEQLSSMFPINIAVVIIKIIFGLLKIAFLFVISFPAALIDTSGKSVPILMAPQIDLPPILNAYEKELHQIVKGKLDQHLFETTLRVLLVVKDGDTLDRRADSIIASVGPFANTHQSLSPRGTILPSRYIIKQRIEQFKRRLLSGGLGFNSILSSSELADLYHFPYTDITKVEGLVKSKSKDLPAPTSMKRIDVKLDIIIGKNLYGGEENLIGLTLPQRRKHMYILGKTGMGKTTLIEGMIAQDMENGKGLMYIDPHGDSFKRLLRLVPERRKNDVIVLNPADRKFPFGLNILSPGIEFEDKDEGQEWISSAAISVFLKLTDKEFWGPRLEHILRNTILTALQTEKPQLYVIQKLLTTTKYQKIVAADLTDPILKQFWADEFSLMGTMQQSNAISPITHRIGKFITNKISRHILLQEKSTINIQKAMDEGKIILVNLAKGELGEDVSSFFGSVLLSLVQLCAYQRLHIPEEERRDFFVYVDEFQNFATPTFSQMFSEGRKFKVDYILSHQDINQIEEMKDIKTIAGNSGNLTIFRASPDDEAFILPYMDPEVEKGEIVNLLPHHFFMKVTSNESEDAFSGVTILQTKEGLPTVASEITSYTREHYTNPRETVETQIEEMINDIDNQIKGIAKNQTAIDTQPDNNGEEIKPKRVKKRGIQ